MQAARPAAPKRRLRQRARLLVRGIKAAPAAEQTETGFDAGRVAPGVQADRQSALIVDAASPKRCRLLTSSVRGAARPSLADVSDSAIKSKRIRFSVHPRSFDCLIIVWRVIRELERIPQGICHCSHI